MYDSFFGYSKKSFKQIFSKLILFAPTIIQIVISIFIALWILLKTHNTINQFNYMVGKTIIAVILFALLNLFLRTGKMYMIKQSLTKGDTSINDIFIGAKKFFLRLFLGILTITVLGIALGLVLTALIFLLFSIGLKILPIIIGFIVIFIFFIFISMWEVIIIYEDCTIFESLNMSVKFAKKHFGILLLIKILESIFTGNNKNLNFRNSNKYFVKNTNFISIPYFFKSSNIKSAIIILAILISVTLQLFFDVLLFELYIDRRDSIEQI